MGNLAFENSAIWIHRFSCLIKMKPLWFFVWSRCVLLIRLRPDYGVRTISNILIQLLPLSFGPEALPPPATLKAARGSWWALHDVVSISKHAFSRPTRHTRAINFALGRTLMLEEIDGLVPFLLLRSLWISPLDYRILQAQVSSRSPQSTSNQQLSKLMHEETSSNEHLSPMSTKLHCFCAIPTTKCRQLMETKRPAYHPLCILTLLLAFAGFFGSCTSHLTVGPLSKVIWDFLSQCLLLLTFSAKKRQFLASSEIQAWPFTEAVVGLNS